MAIVTDKTVLPLSERGSGKKSRVCGIIAAIVEGKAYISNII